MRSEVGDAGTGQGTGFTTSGALSNAAVRLSAAGSAWFRSGSRFRDVDLEARSLGELAVGQF
jgi:hypothetical protein